MWRGVGFRNWEVMDGGAARHLSLGKAPCRAHSSPKGMDLDAAVMKRHMTDFEGMLSQVYVLPLLRELKR